MNWINEKPIECVGKVSPTNGFNYDKYYNASLLGSNRKPLLEQLYFICGFPIFPEFYYLKCTYILGYYLLLENVL